MALILDGTNGFGGNLPISGTINTLTVGLGNSSVSTNTALGASALRANTTGSQNVASGYQALYNNTTGSNNAAFGYNSGSGITTGGKNVIIGSYTGVAAPISATGSNYIVLSDGDANIRMVVDSSGNMGIGVTSPAAGLHLSLGGYAAFYLGTNGSTGFHITKETSDNSFNIWSGALGSGTNRFKIDSSGVTTLAGSAQIASLGVGTAASGTTGEIRATNEVTAYYSDARLKADITNIPDALAKVEQINGVTYTQNKLAEQFGYDDYRRQVGVIAQEIAEVLPEAIRSAPFDIDEDGNSKSGENYLTVKYENIVPLLIEAIKELSAKLKKLEGK